MMFNKIYNENEINQMSPLIWAYIGDSVFEIYIRDKMIELGLPNNTKLHTYSIKYVKAASQSKMLNKLKVILTEEELQIIKRARNTHSNTIPKNSNISEYKNATALEAIIGYWFLLGNNIRVLEILNYCYNEFKI